MNVPATSPNHCAAVTFVGPMHYPATKNLRNLCSQLVTTRTSELYLLFSSTGGSLAEGFALYNFLRALPMKLTIHNIGSVESIANIVFLSADQRFAAPETHFLLHGFDWSFSEKTTLVHERIKEISTSLSSDEERFRSLLKQRSGLSEEKLKEMDFFRRSLVIKAPEAQSLGLVHGVKEAKISEGWQVWNVDY